MADAEKQAVPSLGDFFAKKNKKKGFKGTNMNNDTSTTKDEDPKTKKKDKADEGWEDEEIVAPTMNIAMVGNLTREEDSKDQEDTAAPAWGNNKKQKQKDQGETRNINEKKFPSLAKSVGMSSNINIDDGSQANINIKTSKNVFSALEDENDEDEAAPKRPKEIKPAMVTKVKGEFERVALQREVDKYSTKKDGKKKKKKQKDSDDDDDEEEEDEEEEEEEDKEEPEKQKKKKDKPARQEKPEKKQEEVEVAEDVKIVPDEKASRNKYVGREKKETVPLRKSELEEEEKQNRGGGISKKRQKFIDEEEVHEKKLLVADWD